MRPTHIVALLRTSLLLSFISAVLGTACLAQVITPGSQTGLPAFGTFHGSDIDLVSLQNFSLHAEIPILSIPQRGGHDLNFKYMYETPRFQIVWLAQPTPLNPYAGQYQVQIPSSGFAYSQWFLTETSVGFGSWELSYTSVPVTCHLLSVDDGHDLGPYSTFYHDGYIVTDPWGTKHQIGLYKDDPTILANPSLCPPIGSSLAGYANDGSGIFVDATTDERHPIIRLKDGTLATSINGEVDSNGNLPGVSGTPFTASRVGSQTVWTYTDSNGQPQTYRIDYTSNTIQTAACSTPVLPPHQYCAEYTSTSNVPQKLTLPDGSTYQFTWVNNSYGQLQSLTLPSGGTVTYDYYPILFYADVIPAGTDTGHHGNYTGFPQVKSRTLTDGNTSSTWNYALNGTITTPKGDSEIHATSNLICQTSGGRTAVPYETSASYYQGSGSSARLLKTVTKDYTCEVWSAYLGGNTPGNIRVSRETTTLANGLTSKVETDYDTFVHQDRFGPNTYSRLNVVEKRFYDYAQGVPGPLLKRVHYTYLHDANPNSYLPPNGSNIADRVLAIDTYDGAGNHVAQTVNEYDNYTHSSPNLSAGIAASGANNHNPAFGSSFTYRGNRTGVSLWRNTDNAMLMTQYQYDDTGNILAGTDPMGRTTYFDWSDSWKDSAPPCPPAGGPVKAFLHQITDALQHTQTFKHYSCSGLLGASIDANLQTTSFTYDLMGRLALRVNPTGGGQSSANYNPTIPPSITTATQIASGLSLGQTMMGDNFGRVAQTQLTSDPEGSVLSDTTYDADGRVSTVSNPYRSKTESTYGVTTTIYDGLNRGITIVPQDGTNTANNVTTQYSDNVTTVTDQAGKQRRSISDGLGRLIEIDEPGGGTPAAAGSGSSTVSGSEQNAGGIPGTPGTGSVTIHGLEGSKPGTPPPGCHLRSCTPTIWDAGTVSVKVNGTTFSATYSQNSTALTITTTIANAINSSLNPQVNATATSSTTTTAILGLTATASGAFTNYPLTLSVAYDTSNFSVASFTVTSPNSTLTSGTDGTSGVYDTGSVWIKVNGVQGSAGYGAGDTAVTVAQKLQSNMGSLPVNVSLSGSTITLIAKTTGSGTNYSLASGSSTSQPGTFTQPSFTVSVSNSSLTGGIDAGTPTLATAAVTLYTYDALSNLKSVVQKGNTTDSTQWRTRTFSYNSLSQLLSATNPESGTVTYGYDNDGNLITKTAPAPNQTGAATVTTTYAYDFLNRLKQKSFNDGVTPQVTFGYDGVAPAGCTPSLSITFGIGRRTGMCDAVGFEAWNYDAMGRVLVNQRSTNGFTKNTSYTYNLDSSVATITYPSGRMITYQPGGAGHTLWAKDIANGIIYAGGTCGPNHDGACYAPQGALSFLQNGANIASTLYYNNRLQACRISIKSAGTAPNSCADTANTGNVLDMVYNFSLGTANNGNVTAITNNRDSSRSQSFTYDPLNRIATAQTVSTTGANCWGEQFSYDAWGNLLYHTGITPQYYGCKQESDLSNIASAQNQIFGYAYDAAGNMIATPGPSSSQYTYNAENQLTATSGNTYKYDGDGRRVEKLNSTGQVYKIYWYSTGSDPLDETDASGTATTSAFNEYIFFGGKRIAKRDSSNNVNYYFGDHLGTARLVASATGAILDDSDYYPFGGERPILSSSSGNNYKFTAKERDAESGLDHFGARHYGSTMGRFMQADPFTITPGRIVDPQQFNLYSYVRNNPLRHIDPTGMLIDDSELSDKDKAKWKKIQDIANQKDKDGNYLHPELQKIVSSLECDSRTFVLENSKLSAGTAGVFTITNMTANGKDFTRATLQLDFKKIQGISGVTAADLVPGFNKFQGLLDAPMYRLAEVFGHEGAHGLFAIQNPEEETGVQRLQNQRDAAMQGQHYPYPPDVMQKIEAAEKGLIPTEKFAQQEEKIINGELQADKKKQ